MNNLISSATQKNWERLGIATTGIRLKSRANKTSSDRIVYPVEYFHEKKNLPLVTELVEYVRTNNVSLENVLYAISLRCLEEKKLFYKGQASQQNVRNFIDEYQHLSLGDFFAKTTLPFDEPDLLGLLYQCLKPEGTRNQSGMYYTSSPVANILLRNIDVSATCCFLDPCCGSGNLLLHLSCSNPERLFGIDSDPLAVMIAKCNLIMKFPKIDFSPNIYQRDFLETDRLFAKNAENPIEKIRFDYIVTNPPWGAVSNFGDDTFAAINSKESFSAFLIKSMEYLSENGKLRFLLPESFLHIKTHSNIRSFILENYCIEEIRTYPHSFSGVTTKFIDVTISKNHKNHAVTFAMPDKTSFVETSVFAKNKYHVFSIMSSEDSNIIDHVNKQGKYNLSESVFGLGIVTGDNKSKLSEIQNNNLEAIYSGKEVKAYHLLKAKYYTRYCREEFQQTAKETIYRAPEKLAYKFISRKLVFAYDNSQSLFLNSANLLIPNIKGMTIKTVLALLNSELYQFIYQKQFADIKVLKGNLMELPFPEIDEENEKLIHLQADKVLSKENDAVVQIDNIIYEIFHINDSGKKYIKNELLF
jgi:type I restriction-modification system DNA methylase subunit